MNLAKLRILILCTGNSCRSQIAEGFFRSFGDIMTEISSAGLTAHGLNPLAIKTMAGIGIDISAQTSDSLEKYLNEPFDFVITVCDNAAEKCPNFPGQVKQLHWSIEDPAQATGTEPEKLAVFARIRDQIGQRIKQFLSEL